MWIVSSPWNSTPVPKQERFSVITRRLGEIERKKKGRNKREKGGGRALFRVCRIAMSREGIYIYTYIRLYTRALAGVSLLIGDFLFAHRLQIVRAVGMLDVRCANYSKETAAVYSLTCGLYWCVYDLRGKASAGFVSFSFGRIWLFRNLWSRFNTFI